MPAVNWQATQNSYNTKNALINNNVNRADWIGFLDAMGWMENSGSYGGAGGSGGAYSGMYQVDNVQLNYMSFYSGIGDDLLDVSTTTDFQNSALAQDLAAIMEFSGINMPGTTAFVSKYTAARLAARDNYPLLYANWNSLLGQTISINYVDAQGTVIGTHVVTLTQAGLSGAAHLIGQGALASALNAIYNQCFDANGALVTATANLSSQGDFADGNGIAFSNYILLFQNYDLAPLISAADDMATFNGLAEQLLTHRSEKIKDYLTSNNRDIELEASDSYRSTIRSIVTAFGLPIGRWFEKVDGVVVIGTRATNTFTEDNDVIFHLGSTPATLNGGGGEDYIYGGDGADTIEGGDGIDYLNGRGGADRLRGGGDRDFYSVDTRDTIIDTGGDGSVYLENILLTDGYRKESDPHNVYRSGRYTYELSGTTLIVNGGLRIEQFTSGQLGITLHTIPDDDEANNEEQPDMGQAEIRASPLTVDLNGDGVGTAGYSRDRYFDHDGNGFLESTAWVNANDGLLVRDLNGNGVIDNGGELFGDNTRLSDGSLASNGFIALGELDENHDGRVDWSDASYADLRIWRDVNGNGLTESGEILTLAQAGISAFRTQWTASSFVDGNGQAHRQVGTAIRTNGSAANVSDVWYTTDASRRLNHVQVPVESLADLGALPDARAFGNLSDLRQAMSVDATLRGLVEAYLDLQESPQRDSLLKNIIFQWAGVTHINPVSRGDFVDARELAVVELLSARPYTNQYTPNDPNPRPQAGNLLTGEFNEFLQYIGAQIEAQSLYEGSGIFLGGFASGYRNVVVNWDAFEQYMIAALDEPNVERITDLVRLSTALASYSPSMRAQLEDAYLELVALRPGMVPLIDVVSSVVGTSDTDVLHGSGGKDAINGRAGDDTLYGHSGDDIYIYKPGDGNDRIFDSSGSDQIYFMGGILPHHLSLTRDVSSIIVRVTINGFSSELYINNVFEGTEGALREGVIEQFRFENGVLWNQSQILAAVTQQATSEDDGLYGSSAEEVFFGLEGNDEVAGYGGNDTIHGDAGADNLLGGTGNDVLDGGDGDDTLDAGADDDVLSGGAGSDALFGGAGEDVLDGGLGDDQLEGGEGNDSFNDGGGSDVVNGGDGDDVIFLAADADTDLVTGGKGNDVYHVGSGSGIDRIEGFDQLGAGSDEVVVDAFTRAMLLNYDTNGYDVTLHFGDPATGAIVKSIVLAGFLSTNSISHSIRFADGAILQPQDFRLAYWSGTGSADTYTGGFAPDHITGGGGDDILSGALGPDTIYGSDGNDLIEGGSGADRLYDGTGADIVNGGEGDDHIYAEFQWGDDQYRGGLGNDTYYYMAYETGAHDYFVSTEIFEGGGEGVDTVITNYYNFSLNSTEVENLIVENTGYQWYTYNYQSVIGRQIFGNELDNVIHVRGNPMAGAHLIIDGGLGNDTMIGSNAAETYVVDSENDVVIEDVAYTSIDTVRSWISYSLADMPSIENIELMGVGTFALGNSGSNRLDGSTAVGANVLTGGLGDDTYVIDGEDTVVELSGEGVDTVEVRSFVSGGPRTYYVDPTGSNIEIFRLHADAGASGIVGNDEDNLLIGNGGANYLSGGGGNDELRSGGSAYQVSDTLHGGAGDDVLIGRSGTAVYMIGGTGDDEIRIGGESSTSISFNRGDGHDVILANSTIPYGTASINFGIDVDSSNVLWTRDGNDLLIQFNNIATDSLRIVGYWTQESGVDGVSGLVDEFSFWNEPGTRSGSTVEALANRAPRSIAPPGWGAVVPVGQSFSYTIPEDMFSDEDVGSLAYAIDYLPSWLSYDASTRTIYGTPPAGEQNASIQLTATDSFGASGSAYFYITVMNVIQGTAGNDTLTGTSGSDMLIGLQGNDSLNGGLGADRMLGGLGNDTYVVDTHWDVVVEDANEGDDLVNVSTSYYGLSDHVERLTFTSSAGESSGYGNELNNTMTGNNSSNSMFGYGGNDTLLGNNGNDYLSGGDGDDTLNGGSGTDEMYGGFGNDRYIVDVNDYIEEAEDEGIDLVEAAITYTLVENFENLTLTGTSGISGNGNSLGNVIIGNSGANTLRGYDGNDYLDGGSGNDTMIGGAGDDTYVVGVAGDVVTELVGEGIDTAISAITYTLSTYLENLTLSGTSAINGTGNSSANTLVGNSGANALSGLGGHDVLEGKGGADTLTGGTGNDVYIMARGYGSDTVVENDATSGNLDVARFLSGVTYDQLWFRRPSSSNNLEITIIGTSDKLIIKDWYLGNQYKVEEIRTSDDAMLLTMANVQTLVSAMSGMTMPAQGQTTLTTAQRNQLTTAFASAWQSQPSQQRVMTSLPASATEGELPSVPTRLASPGGHVSEVLQASKSPSGLCGGMILDELNGIDLLPSLRNVQIKPMLVGGDPLLAERGIPTKPLRMDVGDDLRLLIEAMAGFSSYGQGSLEVHQAIAPHDVRIALPLI